MLLIVFCLTRTSRNEGDYFGIGVGGRVSESVSTDDLDFDPDPDTDTDPDGLRTKRSFSYPA